jgi:hypothetical protein
VQQCSLLLALRGVGPAAPAAGAATGAATCRGAAAATAATTCHGDLLLLFLLLLLVILLVEVVVAHAEHARGEIGDGFARVVVDGAGDEHLVEGLAGLEVHLQQLLHVVIFLLLLLSRVVVALGHLGRVEEVEEGRALLLLLHDADTLPGLVALLLLLHHDGELVGGARPLDVAALDVVQRVLVFVFRVHEVRLGEDLVGEERVLPEEELELEALLRVVVDELGGHVDEGAQGILVALHYHTLDHLVVLHGCEPEGGDATVGTARGFLQHGGLIDVGRGDDVHLLALVGGLLLLVFLVVGSDFFDFGLFLLLAGRDLFGCRLVLTADDLTALLEEGLHLGEELQLDLGDAGLLALLEFLGGLDERLKAVNAASLLERQALDLLRRVEFFFFLVFLLLFVYAPISLPPELFTGFLPVLFPFVLGGLADTTEKVRIVALQAGTNIINHFGSQNLDLVLQPLLDGVVSEIPSARQSSLLLASKLLIHLVTEIRRKHRMTQEDVADEADEGEEDQEGSAQSSDNLLRLDSARDAEKSGVSILSHLEETLGSDNFVRLLAAIHIARSEHNAIVRGEVITAWQVCVASPRTALNKIALGIVDILVKFASSDRPECVDLAEKCIGYTCQRIHEMIDTFLVSFTKHYHGPTERHQIGALLCIAETVPYSERERIQKYTPQICSAVLPALRSQNEVIRTLAATASERVTKVVGKQWNDDIVQRQLSSESVVGVIEVVRANTKHSLSIVFKALTSRDIPTQYDIDLINELCLLDEVAGDFVMHYDSMTKVLCNGMCHGLQDVDQALERLAECILGPEYYPNNYAQFQRLLKTPYTRAAALKCIAAFFQGIPADATEGIVQGLRLVLQSFGDSDGNVRDAAARAFISMTQSLDRKAAGTEGDEVDATAARRAAGRYAVQFVETVQSSLLATIHATCLESEPELHALRFPKLVDNVLNYYNRALDYGGAGNKLQAIEGIEEVIRRVSDAARPMLLNTVMAKCIKTLYERNDGSVVSAVLNLLLHAMDYDKSGKNKILERTIASSVFGATLSESPEARTLGLRVVSELLSRDQSYADPMLAMVLTKKGSLEAPANRAAACRYIAVVMRHGNVNRPVKNLPQLQAFVKPMWDNADLVMTAAAAGGAMGALAISSSMSDDEVGALADQAVAMAGGNGAKAIGGIACLITLIECAKDRIENDIITKAARACRAILPSCGTDRLTALWVLRLSATLVKVDPALLGSVDPVITILKRVEISDDLLLSTAAYVIKYCSSAFPASSDALHSGKFAESSVYTASGVFDIEMEDEWGSATITY